MKRKPGLCKEGHTLTGENRAPNGRCRACKKEKNRRAHLRRTYGISLERYELILESQDHRCALCARHTTEFKTMNVDHCHRTGRIRGLLCTRCNVALGGLGDTEESLQRAVNYLKRRGMHQFGGAKQISHIAQRADSRKSG